MNEQGTQLERLCADARDEVLLVAPFIKAFVIQELLAKIHANVSVNCVTRWYPEEILMGVSDLEIWPLIQERPNTSLWLRADLHAKYYRADRECLIGSANLTAKALGWTSSPNLELLVQLKANNLTLIEFESNLLLNCIRVDDNIFEQMSSTVQLLKEQHLDMNNFFAPETSPLTKYYPLVSNIIFLENWLPNLRNPEDLYLAYSGHEENLTATSRDAAYQDLSAFSVVPNFSKKAFEACIATLLLQKPIIQKVDSFVAIPQRFGAVRDLLNSLPCSYSPNFDADRAWQTLIRWLLYFLPSRYTLSVPKYSEVFSRRKQ